MLQTLRKKWPNVTRFGNIYWRNPKRKNSFLVQRRSLVSILYFPLFGLNIIICGSYFFSSLQMQENTNQNFVFASAICSEICESSFNKLLIPESSFKPTSSFWYRVNYLHLHDTRLKLNGHNFFVWLQESDADIQEQPPEMFCKKTCS